jgi:hypothetical protein
MEERMALSPKEMMTPVKALSSGMINPMTPVMIHKFKESKMTNERTSSSKLLSYFEFDDFYNANAPAINKLCDGDVGKDDGKDDETTAADFEFDDFYNANAPAINKLCDGDDGKDDGKDDETTAAASSWELVDTDDEKIFIRSKSGKRLKKKAKTTATASSCELVDTDDE